MSEQLIFQALMAGDAAEVVRQLPPVREFAPKVLPVIRWERNELDYCAECGAPTHGGTVRVGSKLLGVCLEHEELVF